MNTEICHTRKSPSGFICEYNNEEKEISELAETDVNRYHLLGKAMGINMNHCVILGLNHTDDFWHRLYGYNIVQNEEMEKTMLEAMKRVKPETESYVTVAFYERLANRQIMFVPKHLEIPDRPELNNFPFNIAFCTVTLNDNNVERQETSLYEPDLSTFIQEEAKQKMRYYNNRDSKRYFSAEIVYDTAKQTYVGIKYNGDTSAGIATGINWDIFFSHFTALGLANEE